MSDPRARLPVVDAAGDCHAEWKRPAAAPAELDLATVRARLAAKRGPEYWRSLEELAGSPEFDELVHREFPRFAAEWPSEVSRRNFLQLAAASLGLAGLTACTRQPLERIVPYVRQPEEVVPGVALRFATAITLGGLSEPVLAESHEGRPTKLEGNPDHPAATGGSTAIVQAAVLGLYDPDRSQAVTHLGRISSWPDFQRALAAALAAAGEREGAGLRLLTGPTSSPTEAALVAEILASYPRARWHRWDPLAADEADAGARLAFGRPVSTRCRVDRADVVVALESDFLAAGPGSVRHAREFAARRRPTPEAPEMNRLYAAESSPTPTGTMADHRLAIAPSRFGALVTALAAEVGVPGAAAPDGLEEAARRWARAAGRDLAAHRGRSLVVAGDALPAAGHALVHAINDVLGNSGETVVVGEPLLADPVLVIDSLAELTRDLREGRVEVLVVSGVNPAYDAPADLDFTTAVNREGVARFHHGLYADETAELCQWHLPAAHDLESWGDGRAFDGTVTLRQPLIEPLYGGRTLAELLAVVAGRGETPGYDLLRERWAELADDAFRRALHDGFVAGSGLEPVAAAPGNLAAVLQELAAAPTAGGVELALRPDPALLDGRFANNGWLQELPKPVTKLTWDNALLVSPRTAERLGVGNEQVVEVAVGGRRLAAPAWIVPGQADEVATLHLGYGRRRGGRVADGAGVDAYRLQASAARWNQTGVTLTPTRRRHPLACTQGHYAIDSWLAEESEEAERRHVVRAGTLDELKSDPSFVARFDHAGLDTSASFAPGYAYDGHAWAMTIDLNACHGCNACVVACQAENNIPVVGREQVRRGREMHWIRVDRYFQGGLDEPEHIVSQPVPCMQCEQAPCETVCPVAATVHSSEGLNDMVYNRCVGTRYCSNNCPYKVRRFNFLLYADWETPQLQLGRNPNVTVRSRGVMEKCTYCTQRISKARIAAARDGRKVRDGEITTACQQACPTHAIVFGDQNEEGSAVAREKRNPRNYALLAELGTRPRTTYLAVVRNPNPELAG
jgi:molybdopterin-containing oxidoreductase family iron-sulfur binding subunit